MANKLQIMRGLKSKISNKLLSLAEPYFCTDTREFYMGTGSGNVNMGGSMWYKGTAMSGTSTTTGAYSYSACPQVKVGDTYLNTSNGNIYECTTAGSGTTAKWTYKGCLKGVPGDKGDAATVEMDEALYCDSTNPVQNKAIKKKTDEINADMLALTCALLKSESSTVKESIRTFLKNKYLEQYVTGVVGADYIIEGFFRIDDNGNYTYPSDYIAYLEAKGAGQNSYDKIKDSEGNSWVTVNINGTQTPVSGDALIRFSLPAQGKAYVLYQW